MSSLEHELLRQAGALRGLARALVGRDDAEDLVQETALRAMRAAPPRPGSLAGYLATVLRRLASTHRRGERRRRERERLAVSPAGEARPDQVLARGEILQRLVAALLALPAPYRDALLQRYFEDRSPGDIATASGVPLATVKTRLRRGLGHLRTLLDGGGDGEGGGAVDWRPTLVAAIGLRPATVAAAPTGVLLMTASTKLTLGAAIAVAALAALLFWSSWSGGTAPPADETSSSVAANVAAQSSRTGPPTGERLAGTGVVERRQISPAPTAVGPMVQVRVSDPGGSPVAFAEVLRSEPNRAPLAATLPAAERRLLQWDSEAWLARFGATVETDADGIARWPWRELPKNGQWQCVARRGELYGELYVSPMALADEVHELRLQPDRSCRVVVVDAQGRSAAAIPIAARYSLQRDAGAGQTSCGWTDSAGLCVVRHVQLWSDRIEPRGSTLPARFCVAWPGIDVGVEVDAARLPEESLTLVLPDSGSVEVHVRTNAGQPVVGRVFGLADAERPSDGLWTARTDAQGVARFASVALGRSWLVGFEHAPPDRYRAVDGPRRAGELARVDWTLDDDAVLVGRLLRDGAPLAGVALQVAASTMPATATPIATDGDGVFQLRFALGPRERRLTEIRLRPADDDRGVHGTCATWRGDLLLAPGEYDLGALVVLPEPIVVEVQFVVPQGTVASDVGFAVEAATGPPEDPWRVVPLPKRREGEDRFAVFGEVPAAALRLVVATEQQFLPVPPLPFVAGTRDLRVELRRGGSVRASVVAGGHIEAFCLQPLLLPADGRFVGPGAGDFDPGRDPRVPRETGFVADDPLELAYVWPAVAPGRYRFELRARGVPRPLRVLDGIEVADGERTVDPRLQHLKVAGLRAIEITLPQADGTPIALGAAAGVVAVLDGDAPGEPCWRVDGPTVFFANDTAIDVLVRLPGCRDRIVRGVDGKQTITLEPGVPVALTLDGYRPPPGGAIRIELEALEDVLASRGPALYSAAAGGALGRYRSLRVGGECTDGGVQLRLPAPGQYRVVARTEAAGGTRTGLAITPSELAVGAAGGEWTVRVDRGR